MTVHVTNPSCQLTSTEGTCCGQQLASAWLQRQANSPLLQLQLPLQAKHSTQQTVCSPLPHSKKHSKVLGIKMLLQDRFSHGNHQKRAVCCKWLGHSCAQVTHTPFGAGNLCPVLCVPHRTPIQPVFPPHYQLLLHRSQCRGQVPRVCGHWRRSL